MIMFRITWLNSPAGRAPEAARDRTRHHVRHVLPFVSGDGDRALDPPVEIDIGLDVGSRMREFLHGPNDFAYPLYSFERLLDGLGDFLAEVLQVGCFGGGFHRFDEVLAGLSRLGGFEQQVEMVLKFFQIAEGFLQETGIVPHVLRGGVYLVGDPRGELADRFELLRLNELAFQYFAPGHIGAQKKHAGRTVGGRHRSYHNIEKTPSAVRAQETQVFDLHGCAPAVLTVRDGFGHFAPVPPDAALFERYPHGVVGGDPERPFR